jgi:hypothetical protein
MKGEEFRANLNLSEITFLRWLHDEGGIGTRSGNVWIGSTDRLTALSYVEAQRDKFNLETIHYTLTSRGLAALKEAERHRR